VLALLAANPRTAILKVDLLEITDGGGRRAIFRKPILDALVSTGLVSLAAENGARSVRLTAAGRKLAERLGKARGATKDGPLVDPLRAQHGVIEERPLAFEGEVRSVRINASESPLATLHRRKGADGQPLIGAAAYAAGERLRSDYTRAALEPRMGVDWSRFSVGAAHGGAGLDPTEAMIAARQRFDAALAAVGPELSGPLFDLCCFLKGLEQIERERGWPVRSAKVVVRLGLERLARHYGFDDEARGRERAPLSGWVAGRQAAGSF